MASCSTVSPAARSAAASALSAARRSSERKACHSACHSPAGRASCDTAAESADAAADLVAGLSVEHDAIERTLALGPELVRDRDAVAAVAGTVVDAAVARFHAATEAAR